jgi:hypothetical protein
VGWEKNERKNFYCRERNEFFFCSKGQLSDASLVVLKASQVLITFLSILPFPGPDLLQQTFFLCFKEKNIKLWGYVAERKESRVSARGRKEAKTRKYYNRLVFSFPFPLRSSIFILFFGCWGEKLVERAWEKP